jgi:hypothetical protein
MPTAQRSQRQRRAQCCWQSFPGDVAQIDSNHAIRQREKIQKVAAHFMTSQRQQELAEARDSGGNASARTVPNSGHHDLL